MISTDTSFSDLSSYIDIISLLDDEVIRMAHYWFHSLDSPLPISSFDKAHLPGNITHVIDLYECGR